MSGRRPPDFDASEFLGGLSAAATAVDAALEALLPAPDGLHGRVHEAMRYAVFAGGKRLRPFLVLESARLFGGAAERAHARGRRHRMPAHLFAGP